MDTDDQSQQKELIKKFEEKRTELMSENEELNAEIYESENSKKWVDWVIKFKNKMTELRNINNISERKTFSNGTLKKVIFSTASNEEHSILISFRSPYVGDKVQWNDPKIN